MTQTFEEQFAALHDLADEVANDAEAAALTEAIRVLTAEYRASKWQHYPWQHPHRHVGDEPGKPTACTPACFALNALPVVAQGMWMQLGGRGCVAGWTRVYLPEQDRHERIDLLARGDAITVQSWTPNGPRSMRTDGPPFFKGYAELYEVVTDDGTITVTDQHRFLTPQGWRRLADVRVGQRLGSGPPVPRLEPSLVPSVLRVGGRRSMQTNGGSRDGCRTGPHSDGQQLLMGEDTGLVPPPSLADVAGRTRRAWREDDPETSARCSHAYRLSAHLPKRSSGSVAPWLEDALGRVSSWLVSLTPRSTRPGVLSRGRTGPGNEVVGGGPRRSWLDARRISWLWSQRSLAWTQHTRWTRVRSITPVGRWPFYDMTVPGTENYAAEGLYHHNTGKTQGAAEYVNEHAKGPACDPRLPGGHRMAIVAPTMGDAVEACVTGPSGLKTINPGVSLGSGPGGLHVTWPNKSVARLMGAYTPEDIERLRAAGGRCLVWMEELAAMRHLGAALDHTSMGLRLGATPHYVASTTPKPRAELINLLKAPSTIITKGRTSEAIHLDPAIRAVWESKYAGTRIGQQELDAELLEDVEGALWTQTLIDLNRVAHPGPDMHRVVVAVDPPGGSTECGIIVAGSVGLEGYVIKDLSGHMPPSVWAKQAVDAFHTYGAEVIAVETAYGGDMVISTIRTVDASIPIVRVPTKVGKRLRAEPVVALFEQFRVHHIGILAKLEEQMREWVPDESESPDRLDAMVHALTYLLIKTMAGAVSNPAGMTRQVRGGSYDTSR